MRTWRMLLIAVGLLDPPAGAAPASRTATICMPARPDPAVISRAQAIASAIFGEIGITLNWSPDRRFCGPANQGIVADVLPATPPFLHPGALAYSTPYGGSPGIMVFYDRIRRAVAKEDVPAVLGHVLAHEIAHMLQRSNEHSSVGIMKARWTREELREMRRTPLCFQPSDLILIEAGIGVRRR